ncbi:MAG: hypothetical protein H7Y01_07910, partial [Ferruginibacter sp.]|nr:hypothetical protein [Chitinophagaceae bacterium]
MPKPVFVLLLLLSARIYGQTDSTENSTQKGWTVTLTGALIPAGPTALGIQPGAEYKFNDRLSLLSEITFKAFPRNSGSLQDRHYMRFKSELRWHFFTRKKRAFHEYAGFQAAYSFRRFINSSGYYYENQERDSVIFFDKAKIKSPIATFALQVGTIIADGRFVVDVFMGFGARIVQTTPSDVSNPRKGIVIPRAFYRVAAYNYAGTVVQFHFNTGIRFMWHFYDFQHSR